MASQGHNGLMHYMNISSCFQVEKLDLVRIPIQMGARGCPLLFQMVAAQPDQQPVLRSVGQGQGHQLLNSLRPSDAYVSMNLVVLATGNSLSPVWHQAITWTHDDLLFVRNIETSFADILFKTNIRSKRYGFENVICKILVIFFFDVLTHCGFLIWYCGIL